MPADPRRVSAWDRARPAPAWRRPRRPVVGALTAGLVLALVATWGAVSAGVVTTGDDAALPTPCRAATVFAVAGSPAGSADALRAVTDPLAARAGDALSVVTVSSPEADGSYAAAEARAVDALAGLVGDHLASCSSGAVMLLGHSEGAQVAGDLASRVGTGQEARIPAERVVAVGLFGDPARTPSTRVVPEGTAGQGVLPPRAAGFGALDARTIEVCAPSDPVCDAPGTTRAPSLADALDDPAHDHYAELTVSPGLPATRWAAESLARVVAALPAPGPPTTAPTTTTPAASPTTTRSAPPSTHAPTDPPTTTAPVGTPTTTAPVGTPSTAAGTPSTVAGTPSTAAGTPTTKATTDEPSPATSPATTTPTDTARSTGATWAMSDGLDGFKGTPWNNQGATDPTAATSPNLTGRRAVKFVMPGGGKRTEVEPDVDNFADGETAFVGYSGYFDAGFPVDTDDWQLIMQFKQPGEGSPPLAVEVGHGQLRLANNGGNQKDFCAVSAGAPFQFQLGITFGGSIDAWCDGRQTLTGYTTPEPNVAGSAYLKTGIYRNEGIGGDSTLYLDDLKIGTSRDAVSGLAGSGAAGSDSGPTADAGSTTTATTTTDDAAAPPTPATDTTAPTPATDTTAPTTAPAATPAGGGQKICDKFGSADIAGGRYMVQNNEWGASDGQCLTATATGFTVDSGDHHRDDAPAAYPSIMSGCWMGTCTQGTTLPARIGEIGPIRSSIAATVPAGTRTNLAYDLWADSTPKKDGANDALELMIWLRATDGIAPIGTRSGTAALGGATWDVWTGENGGVPVISYVRRGAVDRVDDLPLSDFVRNAAEQGVVADSAYLTNIQAGFEPWSGGPGLRVDSFSVTDGR